MVLISMLGWRISPSTTGSGWRQSAATGTPCRAISLSAQATLIWPWAFTYDRVTRRLRVDELACRMSASSSTYVSTSSGVVKFSVLTNGDPDAAT